MARHSLEPERSIHSCPDVKNSMKSTYTLHQLEQEIRDRRTDGFGCLGCLQSMEDGIVQDHHSAFYTQDKSIYN